MITLFDIIDKKDEVTNLITSFGYSDNYMIRLEPDDDAGGYVPHFVINKVYESQHIRHEIPTWLKAKLKETLNCEVRVIPYDRIKKLYRYDFEQNSISINELASNENTKNKPLSPIDTSSYAQTLYSILLEQANKYLAGDKASEAVKVEDKKPDEKEQDDGPVKSSKGIISKRGFKREADREPIKPTAKKGKVAANKVEGPSL